MSSSLRERWRSSMQLGRVVIDLPISGACLTSARGLSQWGRCAKPQSFHPNFGTLNLSTDGSLMVYRGRGDGGQPHLWLRPWDALEATPIRNTDGAHGPAISPDGREVVFVVGTSGSIRVVPLEGGYRGPSPTQPNAAQAGVQRVIGSGMYFWWLICP